MVKKDIYSAISEGIEYISDRILDMSEARFLNFREVGLKIKPPGCDDELDVIAITNISEFPRHIRFIKNFLEAYLKCKYNLFVKDIENDELKEIIYKNMENIIPRKMSMLIKKLDSIAEEKINDIFVEYTTKKEPANNLEKVIFPLIKRFDDKGTVPIDIGTKIIAYILVNHFQKLKYVSQKFALFYMSKTYNYVLDRLKQVKKHGL